MRFNDSLLRSTKYFSRATVHVIKGWDIICAAFVLDCPCFAVCGWNSICEEVEFVPYYAGGKTLFYAIICEVNILY